jgi:hypothetical protein
MPNTAGAGLPNPQVYEASGQGVVRDRVTGLSWQGVMSSKSYTVREGNEYCAGLTLDGQHDWRLPSMIELVSIADTSRADVALDPAVFGTTPPELFWSSQTDVGNSGLGWYLSFKTGGVYIGNDVQRFARVRCVRGHPTCDDPEAKIYSVASESVHDEHTRLTWRRAVEHDNYAWQDAKDFCAKLGANGGGWRLPSLRELMTIVDVTRFDPAVDRSIFPDTPSELFWSSSPSTTPRGTAWGVNFTRGASAAASLDTKAHVRCAR